MPPYARVTALAALGLALLAGGSAPAAAVRPATAAAVAPPARGQAPAEVFKSARTYDEVAVPVRLRIPALGVDAKIEKLGLQRDGTIAVPATTDIAGWYEYGPRPGQAGPAVLLGHVDSQAGPGIFIDLYRARPGTTVRVDRADGSSVTFRITKVTKVPKVQFPTDLVYAPTLDPTLRLVTCGGSFDRARGSYRDNVIAFATPA
ncbi:class F sortase [Actinoplanes sp. KI2]|uniref:class F sortase n=1 Tax=Actinoplanes sp. KI2 TaxID=2983315 RepID=UPI0021D5D80B|nr:class F sortase [Actinoplanes sp. KI2]MCU7728792.1 class F sortase [Actinoplanes sp. KI2]